VDETAKESIEAEALVIGGGPAGLFLAASLAEARGSAGDSRIVLVEKMPGPGRKLLASGSGQCNISHAGPVEDFLPRYGGAGRFLKKALYAFSNEDLSTWLEARGVELVAEEGGKLFPSSRRASDILRALVEDCEGRGVRILAGKRAVAIGRDAGSTGGPSFLVETADTEAPARHLELRAPLLALAAGAPPIRAPAARARASSWRRAWATR
jgi:predicted flavoprotein YhiN